VRWMLRLTLSRYVEIFHVNRPYPSLEHRPTIAHHAEHFALVSVMILKSSGYDRAPLPEAAQT